MLLRLPLVAALSVAAIGLALSGSGRASAAVGRALDLEELAARADGVWHVECVDATSRYDERGRIVTDVTLVLDDSMKGRERSGDDVVVTLLGGAVGDIGMQVPGEARLPVGAEAIVFARQAADGTRRVVGMSQGVLPIVRENGRAMVHPGGRGMHLVEGAPGARTRGEAAIAEPAPLETVKARIRAIVAAQAGANP